MGLEATRGFTIIIRGFKERKSEVSAAAVLS